MEIICSKCAKTLDADGVEAFTQCECSECGALLIVPKKFGDLILQNSLGRKSCFDIYEGFDLSRNMAETVFVMDNTIPEYDALLRIAREEAALLSALKQTNISPIINTGEVDGVFFASEPFMDGYSMSSYNSDSHSPLEIENVIEIMKSAAMGLATAHHRDIPHHDISPENIHVDARGNVRIKNYFLSRFIYKQEEKQNTLNIHSSVSPYFISPEKTETAVEDKRGDVFSYGALFYFLLTGKYPFNGRNELEIIYSRIKKIKVRKDSEDIYSEDASTNLMNPDAVEYAPPHPLGKLRPEINEELSAMIMKALSYYPPSRPTVTHILDFINQYQAEQDKEKNFVSIQRKMILAKTVVALPPKKNGISALFKH
ncbi:MAG: hypothetical protein A2017_09450 [Lentisphaerae bacterium GWF2_44_16]|nr:MAG: hypothetical protein A2017_09450 [Lentisphaerae bacterium GWF2_44_16]